MWPHQLTLNGLREHTNTLYANSDGSSNGALTAFAPLVCVARALGREVEAKYLGDAGPRAR